MSGSGSFLPCQEQGEAAASREKKAWRDKRTRQMKGPWNRKNLKEKGDWEREDSGS